MLDVIEPFFKFIWTVSLHVKVASTVILTIRSIFMSNKPHFLLHTDYKREF